MVNKISKKLLILLISMITLCSIGFLVANNNKDFMTVAYAEEVVSTPTEQGTCGTSATWEYYEDTATLEIKGSGEITVYNYGTAPWSAYGGNIKKVIVADTITSISNGAFYGLNNLQEITLPFVGQSRTATYTTAVFGYIFGYKTNFHNYGGYDINGSYIQNCSQSYTSSVFVPYSSGDPSGFPSNTTWQYSVKHVEYSSCYGVTSYYYYIPSSITKVTITDASKIDAGAFFNCKNITEINLNDEVTTIDQYAFAQATKLDAFKLPNSLTTLGNHAMYNCDGITDIEIPNGVTKLSNAVLYDCSNLTNIKLHANITKIEDWALHACYKLNNVDLPENLLTIGQHAFSGNTSFTQIVIPNKVTEIFTCAFENCSNVTELVLGTGLKTIHEYAFRNLSKVNDLIIPNNVEVINVGAFEGWNSLQELSLPFIGESRTATGPNATFGYIFGYYTNYIEQAVTISQTGYSHETYKVTVNSSTGSTSYATGSNDSYATYRSLYSVAARYIYTPEGANLSNIGQSIAYRQGDEGLIRYIVSCSLNTLSYPSNATWQYSAYDYGYYDYLRSYFYYIPTTLTKVNVTDAENIPVAAFMNCENITEINLNNEIAGVGDYAFYNSSMVKNSTDDLVVSGNVLLAYKGTATVVDIPEGIEVIASRAFYDNNIILAVNFKDETHYIGDYAFYSCENLTVNVPRISGMLSIQNGAFTYTGSVKYLDKSSYTNGNDTYYYNVDANGNAIIVDCVTTSVNITLPVTLGGYTVTTVGYRGMADCTTLSAITIPNNITRLELYAFAGCTGLDVVTIPATCTYVGEHAFSGCSAMTTAIISEGVLYLGDYAFENCISLTEIVVPDSCEYLGKYAFYNCVSMKSASVGNSTPAIQEYTFYNCEKLKTIVVGIKVESIGDYAFYNTALTTLYLHQLPNLKAIGDYAFASCDNMTTVRLRAIESLGDGVFMGNGLLSAINLPNTLNEIGAYAFHGCSSLTSITIPALVTNVKDYTFAFAGLETATVNGTLDYIGEKAFYRNNLSTFTFKDGLTSIGADAFAFNKLTNIVLPNSLTYIGEQAFNECNFLASVSMPDSVSYVGQYAFSKNASDLTVTIRYNTGKIADYMLYNTDIYAVVMENGITEIGDYVFALNHELASITFSNTLQEIGDYAFYDNRMYSELTLPNTVTNIGTYAFARGYNFVKINIPDSVQAIGSHAFYREQATDHISPEFTVEIYYNKGVIADNLLDGQHIQHIIVNDYIHTVGNNAFSNCMNLMDISLPDTIASFGNNCFQNDVDVTMTVRSVDGLIDNNVYNAKLDGVISVQLDDSNVGDYAFAANPGLKMLSISATSSKFTMTSIGAHAFDSCKSMGAVVLPTTVNYIGSYAFYDCNSMSSINIPNGIERIKSHTFYGCAALQNIETPNSVVAIEDYAFYGCVVAKTITISNICEEIGEAAFYNCKAVEELIIPDSVKSIGDYAFRSCVEVTELRFSDNIETLGASAFYDCNALESVYLGKKIIELKDNLFYGCVNLKSLYVYAPLSYIDETAFFGAYEVTVYCGRDDYMINFFDENFIFYEILDELVYEYKIVFQTDSGEIISSETYTSGSTVTVPTNPTKTADETYTYVFAGWDSEVTIVGGNKTYTANFTPVYIDYTVVFKNYDGTEISSKTYHYGDKVVAPSTPVKPANNTYTYTFNGWDNEVVDCVGNATYTATYTPVYINYTVEFKNYDGTLLSSKTYHYGDTVVVPSNPTKPADNTYTYSFKDWGKEVVNCAGNTTYTATYNKTYIDYIVVFEDEDGTVLSEKTYHYGDAIIEPSTPTKDADNTFTYSFNGWNKTVVKCNGNATYTATYKSTYIEYIVVFKNYDDEVIQSKTYHFGDTVVEPTTPTKPSDNTYYYTFNGWDNAVGSCVGNTEYKATYTATYIDYTITFKNADGSEISKNTYHWGNTITVPANPSMQADKVGNFVFKAWDSEIVACNGDKVYTATYDIDYIDYTVIFKNYDGEVLSEKTYHYGDSIVEPTAPSKPADESCAYGFSGWDSEVVNCDGNKTYIAQFVPTNIEYTVIFKDYDGTELSSKTYHFGDEIIEPANPTRLADNTYTYTFNGWDKDVVNCNGNAEYKATYTATYIDYTITFKNDNGTILSEKTYHYGQVIVEPTTPTKDADKTYTYAFKSWDKEIVNCEGNAVYTATYNRTHIEYTVIFKNYDGEILSEKTYHYGDDVVEPATPTKPADESCAYGFSGWDSEVVNCDGNKTYIAQFVPTNIEYTVTFLNWDNSILSSKTYNYGDKVVVPTNPTKPADNTYTYTFNGWDKDVADCNGNATYVAQYKNTYIEYTVTFLNWDNSEIKKVTYHYGDTIVSIPNPERENDETFTYEFSSWNKPLGICTGNTKFTAQYDATYINYSVVFKDENGVVLSRKNDYHYGDAIVKPTNPEKASDNTYTYAFKGWKNFSSVCVGNAEYTPEFTSTYIEYSVVFKNYDNSVISSKSYHYGDTVITPSNPSKPADNIYSYTFAGWDNTVQICNGNAEYKATYTQSYIDYTVEFKDSDGTILSSNTYHYGDEVIAPTNPTKMADNTCTYSFKSWDKEIVNCNGNTIYTATYNQTYIDYTVVFKNYDGTEISSTTYHYGDAVVAPSTPSKAEDNTYTYTFSGWDKEVVNCNGNATYTAMYSQEYRNYIVKFVNDDGTEISSASYHYGDKVVEPTAPTKASDGNYTYTFAGWDSEVVNCNGDKTYTATYNSKPIEKGGSGCASVTTGGSSGGAIGDGFTVALATMGGAAVLLMVRRKKEKYNET